MAQLVEEGRRVEAIKRLRDETGLELREAKDYIDKMTDILKKE